MSMKILKVAKMQVALVYFSSFWNFFVKVGISYMEKSPIMDVPMNQNAIQNSMEPPVTRSHIC